MTTEVLIRGKWDRLRYTLIFEALLIVLLAPTGAILFDRDALDVGLLSLILSIKAMLVSLIYNYIFDRVDARNGRVPTQRSLKGRIVHALGFELVLICTSLPIIVWWLQLGWLEALIADLMIVAIVVLYTLVFTRAYDHLFPVIQEPLNTACPDRFDK